MRTAVQEAIAGIVAIKSVFLEECQSYSLLWSHLIEDFTSTEIDRERCVVIDRLKQPDSPYTRYDGSCYPAGSPEIFEMVFPPF